MAMSTERSTKRRTLPKQPDGDASGTWRSPRNGRRPQGRTRGELQWTVWGVLDETGDDMSATETTIRECRHFIAGEWVDAEWGASFDDREPYTADVFAHVPAAARDDARRAIDAAAEAFPAWSATPPVARQTMFLSAADVLERRATRSLT